MKLYKANHYFRPSHGLDIFDESGETVINIKAASSNDVRDIANKVLAHLNHDYYTKKAFIADNAELYNLGLITKDEQTERDNKVLTTTF